ncbi:MAG: hypothetical protein KC713_03170 [Candidatus Omnitrophica bacterium]|nr:hypothetical protein [Candidatus Omnitrophota bacterium]
MKINYRSAYCYVLSVFLLLSFQSCAGQPYRTNPRFEQYFQKPKKVSLMPPDVKMYQLTAGGVDEFKQDWTETSEAYIRTAIVNQLNQNESFSDITEIKRPDISASQDDFLREQQGLYNAAAKGIVLHTYYPDTIIKARVEEFDYTLGSAFSNIGEINPAETFLFYSARNYIWTAGRVTMFILAAAVYGENAAYVVPAGEEYINLSLVDAQTGDVIWFNHKPMPGDLRKEKVADKVVKKLFEDFPYKDKKKD